ncbi:hypothetical protein L3Q82_013179 [Scortum barcoo]|uniref:Uncharacterized protein n=1 Tax=Scortum barcoo TaxID=214431 RepID=A0ACB8W1B4_9TELE|nr:hypothetical protein L3Q82_013179 [Scortum barcoo]
MKKTSACDESMIITIPIVSLKDARQGQLMPEKFQCVYRDFYKIFVIRGKPQPLGAAQIIAGLFIVILGLMFNEWPFYPPYHPSHHPLFFSLPSLVFVVSGALSIAAGQLPNMHVAKLSFSLNIISVLWSVAAICLYGFWILRFLYWPVHELHVGIMGLIVTLLIVETLIALFLIYWLSKAVCREHFNTLVCHFLKTHSNSRYSERNKIICNLQQPLFFLQPIVLLKQAD